MVDNLKLGFRQQCCFHPPNPKEVLKCIHGGVEDAQVERPLDSLTDLLKEHRGSGTGKKT